VSPRFLFLDSGPLDLLIHPQPSAEVIAVTEWRQSVADKRRHERRRGTHECVRHIAERDHL
jgi:hypothetical protein